MKMRDGRAIKDCGGVEGVFDTVSRARGSPFAHHTPVEVLAKQLSCAVRGCPGGELFLLEDGPSRMKQIVGYLFMQSISNTGANLR